LISGSIAAPDVFAVNESGAPRAAERRAMMAVLMRMIVVGSRSEAVSEINPRERRRCWSSLMSRISRAGIARSLMARQAR